MLEPSSLWDPATAASVVEIDEQILEMFVRRIGAAAGVETSRVSLTPSASTVAQLREVVELLTRRERARHRTRLAEARGGPGRPSPVARAPIRLAGRVGRDE